MAEAGAGRSARLYLVGLAASLVCGSSMLLTLADPGRTAPLGDPNG